MAIIQSQKFEASAASVYDALTSSETFASLTKAPAEIGTEEGAAFACFAGQITGRHIELRPNTRIVQAWRVGMWPEGTYSIVRFDLAEKGNTTEVRLEHTGYPEDAKPHLESGWHKMYWEPLKAYLA